MLEKRSEEILGNDQSPILAMRAVTRKSSKEYKDCAKGLHVCCHVTDSVEFNRNPKDLLREDERGWM